MATPSEGGQRGRSSVREFLQRCARVRARKILYSVGVLLIWRSHAAIDVPTWYGMALAGKLQPTLAGWWFGCVSLPLIQFILLRWYFRLFIWPSAIWRPCWRSAPIASSR
jgi:hypothetical protein